MTSFFCGTQMELFIAVQATFLNTMKVNGDHGCQARFTMSNYISGCSTSLNKSIMCYHLHIEELWVLSSSFSSSTAPDLHFQSMEKSSLTFKVLGSWFGMAWRWGNNDRILISEWLAVCVDYWCCTVYHCWGINIILIQPIVVCYSYSWSPSLVILVF